MTEFAAPKTRDDVRIRALELEDWLETIKWRSDDQTWDLVVGQKRFVSSESEKRWVERAIEQHERGETLRFGITLDGAPQKLVGLIVISEIDYLNRSCAYGNWLAPEGARGKGIAFAARLLVYRYLFDELGMNRVVGRILEGNVASRRFSEKFGTIQEGVLRKALFKSGRFQNLVVYSMLRDEFYARYGPVGSEQA